MGPHHDPGGNMLQTEMATDGLPLLAFMRVIDIQREQRVIMARVVFLGPCGEFSVRGHERTCHVVRHQKRIRVDV